MKTKIGKRIRGFRRFLGLSQKEFGQKLGLSFQHISRYERGKIIPSGEILAKICETYHINLNWLLTGNSSRENESASEKFINVSSSAFAEAGNQKELECQKRPDIFPEDFFSPSITALKVYGHGMEPTIFDGAHVGVDTQDKRIISGEVYAVQMLQEGIVIKRVYIDMKKLILRSDNPLFPESSIPFEKLSENFILGRVKWVIQKLY